MSQRDVDLTNALSPERMADSGEACAVFRREGKPDLEVQFSKDKRCYRLGCVIPHDKAIWLINDPHTGRMIEACYACYRASATWSRAAREGKSQMPKLRERWKKS